MFGRNVTPHTLKTVSCCRHEAHEVRWIIYCMPHASDSYALFRLGSRKVHGQQRMLMASYFASTSFHTADPPSSPLLQHFSCVTQSNWTMLTAGVLHGGPSPPPPHYLSEGRPVSSRNTSTCLQRVFLPWSKACFPSDWALQLRSYLICLHPMPIAYMYLQAHSIEY